MMLRLCWLLRYHSAFMSSVPSARCITMPSDLGLAFCSGGYSLGFGVGYVNRPLGFLRPKATQRQG